MNQHASAICLALCLTATSQSAEPKFAFLNPFFKTYCAKCHSGERSRGGLNLEKLDTGLKDEKSFEKWVRIFDRLLLGEMPPKSQEQPRTAERTAFLRELGSALTKAHEQQKGTVLRRLNRREHQNTLNDLFGTNLDLERMLPEDNRSHEFDNVGEALSVSRVHLQKYIEVMDKVLGTAIASKTKVEKPKLITASYRTTREAERFLGKVWKLLDDGAVVRFSGGGYPTGMMRGTGVRDPGRYRIRVTGYAYQSQSPITFSVEGTSFQRGSEKPIYGFYSFPPNKPTTIELETWIEPRYMVAIEPYGISDPNRYKRKSINDYKGPGLAILKVTLEGPLVDKHPLPGHRLIFDGLKRVEIPPRNPALRFKPWYKPQFKIQTTNEAADVTQSIQRVATTAFRRPASKADLAPYLKLYVTQRKAGSSIEESLRTAVTAIFCSPRFLYFQEQKGDLDDYARAWRLSYFLHRTAPDQEMLKIASTGRLRSSEVLKAQTERLLKDARFDRFLVDFCDSWLNLREMDFTIPDRTLFPEYDQYLRYSMPLETREFLRELIDSNLSTTNLVKSDFAMLNSRLAEHYGLPTVTGAKIRKVPLPKDSLRGGLLSQASILKVTANGTNTSPVTRGVWVMERLLGETPQPPPPGIPGVEPDIRGASTLRELLAKHRSSTSCQSCHRKIDPPGFALESFNPIGGYRQRYRSLGKGDRVRKVILGRNVRYRLGPKVDSSGELPTGQKFDDFKEFRDRLAQEKELIARTFATKLLTFATGRKLGFSDRAEVERIVKAIATKGYGARDLIHQVVQSKIFTSK